MRTSDPFDESRMVLVSDNSLIFVNDLDMCKTPSNHPKKYQLALGSKGRSDSLLPCITGDYHPHSNSMQVIFLTCLTIFKLKCCRCWFSLIDYQVKQLS